MTSTIVEMQHVFKVFEDNVVVRDLNMDIRDGEFVTLLGPSGSGKTTILRMIAGFEEASEGRVVIGGQEMNGIPAYRRPLNTVFQQYALFPHLNVYDNVAFGLKMKRVPRPEIEARVMEALHMVQMEKYAKSRIRKLSGGQQQRVAIARALVNRPKVLLLDEPLGALDLKLRREMQLELKRLHRELGITFVYVTHDQEEAMVMSDRIGLIYQGDLIQFSTPQEIYAKPATPFVAGFIGETNLLEVQVTGADADAWQLSARECSMRLPREAVHLRVGDKFMLSVRPETARVLPLTEPAYVRGTLMERVFVGASVKTWVRIGPDLVVQCLENASTSLSGEPGEEVGLSWNCERMVIF